MEQVIDFLNVKEQRELDAALEKQFTDLSRYKYDYKKFKDYCASTNKVISSEALVLFLFHSLRKRVKKNTFNRYYFGCKKMMEQDGIQVLNEDIEKIKKLRQHYKTADYAEQAQVKGQSPIFSQDLLEAVHAITDVRTKAILLVQFYTACRPSEMVQLKANNFNLESRYVSVYMKKQKEMANKRLPLVATNAIKAYFKEYGLAGESYFIGATDRHGTHYDRQMSLSGYNAFLHRVIGLPAYVFRKSLVSHMHMNGADIETIRKQTAHSSAKTLQEHYLKVDNLVVDKFL
ncbi:site-specific integrase [Solibacillus silvestris]